MKRKTNTKSFEIPNTIDFDKFKEFMLEISNKNIDIWLDKRNNNIIIDYVYART